VRVFVAIDVPAEVRRALGELIEKLEKACHEARGSRRGSAGTRWVRTEGMHATLKFIGEVTPPKVEDIKAALGAIHSPAPVELRFRGTGFFPNPRHPRVFWAGIEASPNLAELAGGVDRGLQSLGIPGETRPFHPHLTLARFKSEEGLEKLHAALDKLGPLEFGATRATEFYLYQSVLKHGGAEYTRLAEFPFVKGA
jgi:RNA 2',3'-cyclic 3'-phosphodiesterase